MIQLKILLVGLVTSSLLLGCDKENSSSTSKLENNSSLVFTTKSDTASKIGAAAAKEDTNLTKEEMLTYAIQDEFLARREYEIIMDKYGEQKPFSNIIKAEEKHISQLTDLFKKYNITIPEDNSKDYVVLPESLNEAYKTGVTAEIENIDMYERFLKLDLPQDIKDTFITLRDASKSHLAAFEKNSK